MDVFIPRSAQVIRGAVSLLMNYIQLLPGIPTRLHFTDDYIVERDIPDKESGKTKRVRSLVFYVDKLEGEEVSRTFSVLSEKLAAHFEPFLKDKSYLNYEFVITQMGDGYYKDWNIQNIRLPATKS